MTGYITDLMLHYMIYFALGFLSALSTCFLVVLVYAMRKGLDDRRGASVSPEKPTRPPVGKIPTPSPGRFQDARGRA